MDTRDICCGSTLEHLRQIADAFSNEVVNQYHEFEEFRFLYYSSSSQIELLNTIARGFFSDPFSILTDRIVLNISKITDPVKSCGRDNLSIRTLHSQCSQHLGYPRDEGDKLVERLETFRSSVEGWRNKSVHFDLSVATRRTEIQDRLVPSIVVEFYSILQEYLNLVYHSLFNQPFPIQTVSQFGAADMVRALKQAYAFECLLEKEPERYSDEFLNSKFGSAH